MFSSISEPVPVKRYHARPLRGSSAQSGTASQEACRVVPMTGVFSSSGMALEQLSLAGASGSSLQPETLTLYSQEPVSYTHLTLPTKA